MKYIAQIISDSGIVWEFEGYVQGVALWTPKGKSRPLAMNEDDAREVLNDLSQYNDGDKGNLQIISE